MTLLLVETIFPYRSISIPPQSLHPPLSDANCNLNSCRRESVQFVVRALDPVWVVYLNEMNEATASLNPTAASVSTAAWKISASVKGDSVSNLLLFIVRGAHS